MNNTYKRSIIQSDDTKIAFYTTGRGPSILIVPGALSLADDYMQLADTLAADFTIHIMERRGRGMSGPQGESYSIENEINDMFAILKETGASSVVGHSYGGLIALEAARKNSLIKKLAVYEPGVSINHSIPIGWIPAYDHKLKQKKLADAFVIFVKATNPQSQRLPNWLLKLIMKMTLGKQNLHKIYLLLSSNLEEHKEVGRLNDTFKNYADIQVQTLLLYGGKGQLSEHLIRELSRTIPHILVKKFPRFDHFGLEKKTEIAEEIKRFFRS
jgi:pimeloyl-ACP methyl ester carboxylesterase